MEFGMLVVCRGSGAGPGVYRPVLSCVCSDLVSDGGRAPAPGWASISPSADWRRLGAGVGEGAAAGCQEPPRSVGPRLQLCGGLPSNFRAGRDPGTTEQHQCAGEGRAGLSGAGMSGRARIRAQTPLLAQSDPRWASSVSLLLSLHKAGLGRAGLSLWEQNCSPLLPSGGPMGTWWPNPQTPNPQIWAPLAWQHLRGGGTHRPRGTTRYPLGTLAESFVPLELLVPPQAGYCCEDPVTGRV